MKAIKSRGPSKWTRLVIVELENYERFMGYYWGGRAKIAAVRGANDLISR